MLDTPSNPIARKTLLLRYLALISIILVALSVLLTHYMNDHDRIRADLSNLRTRYTSKYSDKDSLQHDLRTLLNQDGNNGPFVNKKEKALEKLRSDYLRYRVLLLHFGYIDLTLHISFFGVLLLLMYLTSHLFKSYTDLGIITLPLSFISLFIGIIIISQHWIFMRQSLSCVRRLNECLKIELENCLKEIFPEQIDIKSITRGLKINKQGQITSKVKDHDPSFEWTMWRMDWLRFTELDNINQDRRWLIGIYLWTFFALIAWVCIGNTLSILISILILVKIVHGLWKNLKVVTLVNMIREKIQLVSVFKLWRL